MTKISNIRKEGYSVTKNSIIEAKKKVNKCGRIEEEKSLTIENKKHMMTKKTTQNVK